MLGLPVRHQLLELTQTHVHQVGDAIQSSHPLSLRVCNYVTCMYCYVHVNSMCM